MTVTKDYIISLAHENAYKREKYYYLDRQLVEAAERGEVALAMHLTNNEYAYIKQKGFDIDRPGAADWYTILLY